MKLIELRKDLKYNFETNNIDVEDVDFIIAEVLNKKRTELLFVDEITEEELNQIQKCVEQRLNNVPVDKIRECQDAFLDKLRSTHQEVIDTLGSGKIDDETTKVIEAVMADIAGTYK